MIPHTTTTHTNPILGLSFGATLFRRRCFFLAIGHKGLEFLEQGLGNFIDVQFGLVFSRILGQSRRTLVIDLDNEFAQIVLAESIQTFGKDSFFVQRNHPLEVSVVGSTTRRTFQNNVVVRQKLAVLFFEFFGQILGQQEKIRSVLIVRHTIGPDQTNVVCVVLFV